MNYVKHPTLKVGDSVRCLSPVEFVDGSRHEKNDILPVEEGTLAYFQLFTPKQYEIWTKT